MFETLKRRLIRLSRKLYVRVIAIAILSFASLLVSALVGPLIPEWLGDLIGADAVDQILSIIANSMLAVAIFSLTMMTSAFRAAAANWSPRTQAALRQDTVTQNVLATFVGAYLFALIGIILRTSHLIGEREIVVLYGFTLAVVALIVVSIIRWIVHLETLGSLQGTTDRIENATTEALIAVMDPPNGGAQDLTDPAAQIPAGAEEWRAPATGHVEQVYEDTLNEKLADAGALAWLLRRTGDYVHEGEVIARVMGGTPELLDALPDLVPIRRERDFVLDPCYGLQTLAEIASRALSPGINDAGTALQIVGRQQRILQAMPDIRRGTARPLDRLWIVPLSADNLVRDAFATISRDAGPALEVHLAVQRALDALARFQAPEIARAARAFAEEAALRARAELTFGPDRDRFEAAMRDR